MTIEEIYKDFTDKLKIIYDAREAGTITDWVFEKIAGIKRLERITNKHKQIQHSTIQQLADTLAELLQHKPVQYILQEAWFYKMKFFVNDSVLIPRPETEELVEWIVDDIKSAAKKLKVIDVGTGSGCISIALKKQLPAFEIIAIDISPGALLVAKQNAISLNATLDFLQIDFLEEKDWGYLPVVDIIVSNPPYIPLAEMGNMQKNVTEYEPHLALFTRDTDPLIFYEKIARFAQLHLSNEGKIYVEVHEGYAAQVSDIFARHKFMTTTKKDIYGKDRMISACR